MMRSFLLVAIVAAACGGKKDSGGGGGGETETVALGDSGYVIDVPKGWTVDSAMKGFYNFKDNGHMAKGAPQIMEGPPVTSVDDEVKRICDGRTDIKKDTLPGGGFVVSCKGESKMMKGLQTTQVAVSIPNEKGAWACGLETDKDPAQVLTICKSLRKK